MVRCGANLVAERLIRGAARRQSRTGDGTPVMDWLRAGRGVAVSGRGAGYEWVGGDGTPVTDWLRAGSEVAVSGQGAGCERAEQENKRPSPYGLGLLPLMEQTSEINQRRNHHAQPTVCENQYSRKAVTRSCQIPVTVSCHRGQPGKSCSAAGVKREKEEAMKPI